MTDGSLSLFVAVYGDIITALSDYQCLEDAEQAGQASIEGSVILSRSRQGRVFATATGYELLRSDLPSRHDTSLVIGLFAPSLLFLSARDAGVGSSVDDLVRRHEDKKMGFVVDDFLPSGSSAVIVLHEERHFGGMASALSRRRTGGRAMVDPFDYRAVERVLAEMNLRTLSIVGSEEMGIVHVNEHSPGEHGQPKLSA